MLNLNPKTLDRSLLQVIEYRHFIRHPLCLPLSYKVIEKSLKKEQENVRSQTINVSLREAVGDRLG